MVYKMLQTILVRSHVARVSDGDSLGVWVLDRKLGLGAMTAMAVVSTACGAAPNGLQRVDRNEQAAAQAGGGPVTNAQLPINQRFATLDQYLAWLARMNAPIDKPWYREIRPGVYELVTGGNLRILGAGGEEEPRAKRIFTREELERKFGFRK